MRNYIGLDAHSKTCTFVVVDNKGRQTSYKRIKTGESEIIKFLDSIEGSKALTFEESNLSKWLYTIFKNKVDKLVICDPSVVNRRRGPKDDYPDTLHLAQQLRGDFLTPVFHEDNFFSNLRGIVSSYQDLVRDSVRIKNRYKALFRSEALDTAGKKIYNDEGRIKELRNETDQFVAHSFFNQLVLLKKEKAKYVALFKEYEKKHIPIHALSSIPGIGEVRACVIAAIVCSPSRFESKFKFWAYSMLVKYDCKSDGVSYGKQRVPGNRELKNVFMGAAENILKHKQKGLYEFYQKQIEKGLDHRAAKKNLARKIAAIALAVMRKGVHYQESFEVKKENQATKKV
jgi:hypothetical protein